MHVGAVWRADPAVAEIEHLDGARDEMRLSGDVWRFEPGGRLTEIVHADGAMTVHEEDGATLHFDAAGTLVWSIGLDDRDAA